MPLTWRVGGKVALNVYEGDRPMFQCHTPEDAQRVIELLNAGIAERAAHQETQATVRDLVWALTTIIDLRKNHAAEGGSCDGMCEGCSQCVARTAIARAEAKGVLPAQDTLPPAGSVASGDAPVSGGRY